jgi:hypothetical protein
MVTTNACTADCATYWNKTFELPWSFTGSTGSDYYCQWVYYMPDYGFGVNSNACGTQDLVLTIDWNSGTNQTNFTLLIYPEPDCGWVNTSTITGKVPCSPGSYSIVLTMDPTTCSPPGAHGTNCEWSDVVTVTVHN